MIPVFQTISDSENGNCLQAVIASLFDMPLDEVPHFISFKDKWFSEFRKFITSKNYKYNNGLVNKKYTILSFPTDDCFKKSKWHRSCLITPKCLYKHAGINGYFWASVLSPKYFKWDSRTTHAVIIDRDLNIVHDPYQGYSKILQYPLADIIEYNGIIDIQLINPI